VNPLVLLCAMTTAGAQTAAGARPNFTGAWTLNRALSDVPQQAEFGSNPAGLDGDGSGSATRRGRGGYRGGMGPEQRGRVPGSGYRGGNGSPTQNNPPDQDAIQALMSEAAHPSPSLLISHSDPVLFITDAQGQTRLFQTDGKRDVHRVRSGTVESTTKWDGNMLVTEYVVGSGLKVRHTFSLVPNTKKLLEQVTLEGGKRKPSDRTATVIRRIYDPEPAQTR
jgi:hypothetical protein